jgi:cell division protein FtsL
MKKKVIYYVISLVALFIVNVVVSQLTFITNISVLTNEVEIEKLHEQNNELSVKVSKAESLDTIMTKAKDMGFVKNPKTIRLNISELARYE